MSKRKKNDPNPAEEEEEEELSQDKRRQDQPQKVYDFHKKTIEVYPERLRELNRQFLASISTQITTEPYSVLVGNCLDYVRQYFNYEEDLLKYSPWLATKVKQSRSDITKCLEETINVYEALARNDFDRIMDKTNIEKSSSEDSVPNKPTTSVNQSTTPLTQFRPPTTISSSPQPLFTFTKPTTPTATTTTTSITDSGSSTGFNFKVATTPEKTPSTTPFAFSLPNTGFGQSGFSAPSLTIPTSTEKTSTTGLNFAPPKILFAPPPTASTGDQQGTTAEDNEDESNEPPEPEKVQHETDAKLTYRCRMGVNKGGKLVKRGPVQVILKEISDKRQLIVRSDDALGRLYLNILWSKSVEVKKNSTKDLTFICKLNPGMTEIKEGEFVMILFRFDNETERNDAYDNLSKERA